MSWIRDRQLRALEWMKRVEYMSYRKAEGKSLDSSGQTFAAYE